MTPAEFREALQCLGLTQRAAAAWYGVTLPTLQSWRRKGPTPPAERLTRLVLALGRTPAEIDALIR